MTKPLLIATLVSSGFATHLTAWSWRGQVARARAAPGPNAGANVATLTFEPGRDLDGYLADWLRQIDARVEYAPGGRIYHIPRSFTLRVVDLPAGLRADVVREVRAALRGLRRVDGALVDGERVGMHLQADDN